MHQARAHLDVINRITKTILHPAIRRTISIFCFIPTITILVLDTIRYLFPSAASPSPFFNLSQSKYSGRAFFLLTSILPLLLPTLTLLITHLSRLRYPPIPLPLDPSITERDVTVIISLTPTTNIQALKRRIDTILDTPFAQLILIHPPPSTQSHARALTRLISALDDRRITQSHLLSQAIAAATTKIVVVVDENVSWPGNILPSLLAPFEDPDMVAVGTLAHVAPLPPTASETERYWNGKIVRLQEERNNTSLVSQGTGGGDVAGLAGMSLWMGGTTAWRRDFVEGLSGEEWMGLIDGDWKEAREWMAKRKKKAYTQYSPECFVHVTPSAGENSPAGFQNWASRSQASGVAPTTTSIYQKTLRLAENNPFVRALHIAAQTYTYHHTAPLSAPILGTYHHHIIACLFLLTTLITQHKAVHTTILTIVWHARRVLSKTCNIAKKFKKQPQPASGSSTNQTSATSISTIERRPKTSTQHHHHPAPNNAAKPHHHLPTKMPRPTQPPPPPPPPTPTPTPTPLITLFLFLLSLATLPLPLNTPLFLLLIYLHHTYATELAAQPNPATRELSLAAHSFPLVVMWLMANAFGNFFLAKMVLFIGLVVGKEIWDAVRGNNGGRVVY